MAALMSVVTRLRERAQHSAKLADKLQGDDKKNMLEVAATWLELANEAAKRASLKRVKLTKRHKPQKASRLARRP